MGDALTFLRQMAANPVEQILVNDWLLEQVDTRTGASTIVAV